MICSNCGQTVHDEHLFCGACGADLTEQRRATDADDATRPLTTPDHAPRSAHRRTGPIVVTAVVVAAALVIGGLAVAKKGPFSSATAPTGSSAETATPDSATSETTIASATTIAPETTVAPETTIAPATTVAPQTTIAPETTRSNDTTATAIPSSGAATADAAVAARLPAGWVSRRVSGDASTAEYWAGPPASEFDTVLRVVRDADGTWRVSEVRPLAEGGDVQPSDEAVAVVEEFERYIQVDEPMKAHALTAEPFSSDGASAQYSNGDFFSFEVLSVEPAGDGTYFVTVREVWRRSTDTWTFRVTPTVDGMRITELLPAG